VRLLVCIKQVPDLEAAFHVAADGRWIDEGDLAFRLNEYDEYAVEQAVLLKEQLDGEPELTVASLGPGRVTEAIKKALAMGADRGVHLVDDLGPRRDPWQVASALHAAVREEAYDLIFTGFQSADRGSAQVGPLLAGLLGYACLTTVVGFEYADGRVNVRRELEGGVKAVVEAALPAVVTCQLGLNRPRYPTLPNIMKAKRKEIRSLPVESLLPEAPRVETERLLPRPKRAAGLVLDGDPGEVADRLVPILREKVR